MASQTIPLLASQWDSTPTSVRYTIASLRPQIDASLTPQGADRYLRQIIFRENGGAGASFDDQPSGGAGLDQDDLSSLFETNGSITLTVGDHSITIGTEADDLIEPYTFTPSNAAEVTAFAQAVEPGGAMAATLVLRDFVPAPTVDHAVDAGSVSFAFALPEPTVTHTPATTAALVLSDFVLADGLETEVLGLIEAAAPIDVFSRSPRPARGTLIDGELDLSGDSEPVTRFRFRAQATNTAGGARITLNDSGTLSLADFFGSGGGGADLTVWVLTSAGVISFASLGAIADSTQSGDNFVTWEVPTNDQLLVAGITDGDLFIFALTRPEPESADHAVNAGDSAWAFALPQPTVTHVPFVTPATTDHAVNAGDAAFAFALPEPTVTHTPASSGETVSVTVPLTGVSVFTNYIRLVG